MISRQNFPKDTVNFVADPFLIQEKGRWHMYFEILPMGSRRGIIAHATSQDGFAWGTPQTVLEEDFHLSYPYVFRWKDDFYMIPETYETDSIRLYKANPFPHQWVFVKELLHGTFVDSSIFEFRGKWYLFTCPKPKTHDTLELYMADSPLGPWLPHSHSPVHRENASVSRPGGRVLVWGDRIIRFAQDCEPFYGAQVRAFEVTALSPTTYSERELPQSPFLSASHLHNWNHKSMHHIDLQQLSNGRWLAAVDGRRN